MTFTASNGIKITVEESIDGRVYLTGERTTLGTHATASEEETVALREFFQHEKDEQLGRWRWPENPDYVIYPFDDPDLVWVIEESTGMSVNASRGGEPSIEHAVWDAARAYFDAHPKPKPWHDAKPGEVWVLTMDGVDHAWGVGTAFNLCPEFVSAGGETNMPLTWHEITAGRRIYPEADSE